MAVPRRMARRISQKASSSQLDERHFQEAEELFNQQLNTFYFQMDTSEEEEEPAGEEPEGSPEQSVQLPSEWMLGGRIVHSSHRLGFAHGVSHCWLCGAWCTGTPTRLVTPCRAPTKSGVDSIWMMSKGGMPHRSIKTWPDVNAAPPLTVDYYLNPYGGPHRPKVKVWVQADKLPFEFLRCG